MLLYLLMIGCLLYLLRGLSTLPFLIFDFFDDFPSFTIIRNQIDNNDETMKTNHDDFLTFFFYLCSYHHEEDE
jgi:hypothetical protein